MSLPIELHAWPDEWLDVFLERESIMWAENVPDSDRKAEEDTRRVAAR